MAEPLTTKIADWRAVYGHIYSDLYNLGNRFGYAKDQCDAENWAGLASEFSMMKSYVQKAARHFIYGTPNLYTEMFDTMDWIDDNWSAGGDVTMDSILNAMLSAEYEQLQQFIGIVDGYRVALWDGWFNTEFYAGLARGFKQLRP